jgi:hypothetical protein
MRPRLTYPNVVATLCLVAVVGGSAVAATSTSSSTITACAVKKGKKAGALRVISAKKKCKKTEKKVSWNKQGVAGATGSAGTAGAAGSAGADAVAPAGAVMFFATATCPAGYTEYAAAQGRYVVGLPPGGTLEKTDGTALGDGEDRPTGQHDHAVTVLADPILVGGNVTVTSVQGTAHTSSRQPLASTSAASGITVGQAGSVAGTNAPYIQLLACRKS